MAQLIVLTPNPAVDVTYRVPAFDVGATVRVSQVQRRPGGKGLNVVRVLRTLGEEAVAVLPLGGSAGRWVASMMDEEHHACEVVTVDGETRSTVAIVDPVGHPTLFSEPGPALSPAEGDRLIEATVKHCEPGCVVVVSGSLPRGVDADWVGRLVRAVRGAGARVLVDTSGPALVAAARAGADLLKPNAAEAIEAMEAELGTPGHEPVPAPPASPDIGDNRLPPKPVRNVDGRSGGTRLRQAVQYLQSLGASTVVVSQGADGLIAFSPDHDLITQRAVRGVTGNPTGAGDAATAGLALAWARGESMETALRQAAVLGAAAVKQPTAGEVDLADVRAFDQQLSAD
ncbi:hexose kinase [Kineosporia sp. NBRC 101731]|uniref:1-phosphofructokinase family hexose kinase n=1 Tax=Kineosporia sp. NBRC 101731 TaxID=3032199 RepID=UPI00249FF00F|nr:hexose kinase [Kineosporia sp. NBRC 101731]GLY30335.1 hypothetical protein Kisp02_37000 [Kineosporia sp. NBRC 101731]